jgi:hypothetical protein
MARGLRPSEILIEGVLTRTASEYSLAVEARRPARNSFLIRRP